MFVFEGEGGLTPGGAHEARHSAWGLGLNNLVFMIDWNDFGIDERPLSAVVYGTPETTGSTATAGASTATEQGSEWPSVTRAVLEASRGDNPGKTPSVAWFKTRKGRGYGKYDAKSHGTPWPVNAPEFWAVRKEFMEKYGVEYQGVDEAVPADAGERDAQARANFATALSRAAHATRADGLADRPADRGCRNCPGADRRLQPRTTAARSSRTSASSTLTPTRTRSGRSPATSSPTAPRWRVGRATSTPSPRRNTADRCSSAPRLTSPSRPTSPASGRTSATCRAGAGTSATPTSRARSCPPRSPSSRTPG